MIVGRVIHGNGLGKALGYPTANIAVPMTGQKLPSVSGIYAARATLQGMTYPAALVCTAEAKLEVHFIGYAGADFYGQEIQVEAIDKVSEIVNFTATPDLQQKIQEDIKKVLARLSS